MKKICIIGSLHWDIVVNTNKIPKKDETASGSKVHYLFGGKGGNQALSSNSCLLYTSPSPRDS